MPFIYYNPLEIVDGNRIQQRSNDNSPLFTLIQCEVKILFDGFLTRQPSLFQQSSFRPRSTFELEDRWSSKLRTQFLALIYVEVTLLQ